MSKSPKKKKKRIKCYEKNHTRGKKQLSEQLITENVQLGSTMKWHLVAVSKTISQYLYSSGKNKPHIPPNGNFILLWIV